MDLIERVTGLEHDMTNMQRWQKEQNGSIHRVEAKVDKLQYWIMGVLAVVVSSLFVSLFK